MTDLAQVIHRRGGATSIEVVWWLGGVARALDEAHARGEVHGPLYPEEVFLEDREDGTQVELAGLLPVGSVPDRSPARDVEELAELARALLLRADRRDRPLPVGFDRWKSRCAAGAPDAERFPSARAAIDALHGIVAAPEKRRAARGTAVQVAVVVVAAAAVLVALRYRARERAQVVPLSATPVARWVPPPDPPADPVLLGGCKRGRVDDCSVGCSGGDARSCMVIAQMRVDGLNQPVDLARAAADFERACTLGDGEGCARAGAMYRWGEGLVTRDDARAESLFAKARARLGDSCAAGNAEGCFALARMHAVGNGVPKDTSEAASLFARACEAASPAACWSLSVLYAIGDGVPKDPAKSESLRARACKGGYRAACVP